MDKIKLLIAALGAALAEDSSDQRDKTVADTLGKLETAVGEAEGGYAPTKELTEQIAQLRKDLDAESEARRRMERAGLSLRDGMAVQPRGRRERLDMLADNRAFMGDEQARRFGAIMAVRAFQHSNHVRVEQLPTYTRELAESVAKDMEADRAKAAPDIEPEVAGSGAELVSDEFKPELIRNVESYGAVFPACRRVPLGTFGTTTFPKRTGGPTVYPIAIAAAITQSGMTFGTVTMSPEQWGSLSGIPMVMFQDPGMLVDLGNLVAVEFTEAAAYAFDNAVVNGDGTASYGGITGILQSGTIAAVAAAGGHTTVALLDGADIDEVEGSLTKGLYYRDAGWYGHQSVLNALLNKRSTTGQYIYRMVDQAGKRSLKGYPWTIAQILEAASAISTGEPYAIYGSLRNAYYWGMLRQIQIDASDHVFFDQNMRAMRLIAYVDAAEADADAVVTAVTA